MKTKRMGYKNNDLKKGAKFALFVSSYLPLFILVILRQLSDNYKFLKGKLLMDQEYFDDALDIFKTLPNNPKANEQVMTILAYQNKMSSSRNFMINLAIKMNTKNIIMVLRIIMRN